MTKEQLFAFWPKATFTHYKQLVTLFGNLEEAFKASEKQLLELKWQGHVLPSFLEWRKNAEQIAAKWQEKFVREKITFIVYTDSDFPAKKFEGVKDPPYVLFIRGNPKFNSSSLAVVGSRDCTEYGIKATNYLIPDLAASGVSIVSGLAEGIDSTAHSAAIKAGGHTVAILGHGIEWNDLGYSSERRYLGEKIIENGGAIISEYLPGIPGSNFTFPKRNRIIAALSDATLITEAAEGSGSLITAECAYALGRDILIVPQDIFSITGKGANAKLKEAAHPITCPQDIFELFGITPKKRRIAPSPLLPNDQSIIFNLLQAEPQERDSLARELNLAPASLGVTLTTMELSGLIEVKNGLYYAL